MFAGTSGLRTTAADDSGLQGEEKFHISDDEEPVLAGANFHISDDEDTLTSTNNHVSKCDHVDESASVHNVDMKKCDESSQLSGDKNLQNKGVVVQGDDIKDADEDDGPLEEKICKNEEEFFRDGNFVVPPAQSQQIVPETTKDGEENASAQKRKRKRKLGSKVCSEDLVQPQKRRATTVFDHPIRPPTLLERLLLDEIKRERNLILQCVRYVCNNRFLQD